MRPSTYFLLIAIGIGVLLTSYLDYLFINPLRWIEVMGSVIILFFYFVGMLTFLAWFHEKTKLRLRWGIVAWNLILMFIGAIVRAISSIFA